MRSNSFGETSLNCLKERAVSKIEKLNEQINEIKMRLNDPNLCKGTMQTVSRVSGFYRSVETWNFGKKQEFAERAEYNLI